MSLEVNTNKLMNSWMDKPSGAITVLAVTARAACFLLEAKNNSGALKV